MKKGILISLVILAIAVVSSSIFLSVYSPESDSLFSNSSSLYKEREPVLYFPKYDFYNFTEPNEGAFSISFPKNWEVSNESGLVRQYASAGILINTYSKNNSGFFLLSPYMISTILTEKIAFKGFKEGDIYDSILIKNYTPAREFLIEYLNELNEKVELIDLVDRPDLIQRYTSSPITKQSAAEMTYTLDNGELEMIYKTIVYTYLDNSSDRWVAQVFSYYSPNEIFDETEYLVFKSINSFNVNYDWATSESKRLNKAQTNVFLTPASVAYTLSSAFDYQSISMDRVNNAWAKKVLGIIEVLDPLTNQTWIIEANSTFYWRDNQGNIYGTDRGENPFPEKEARLLEIQN